jgi:hypothetical protein
VDLSSSLPVAKTKPTTQATDVVGIPCRCGHVQGAHEHYRRGSDCALCPCVRFRSTSRRFRLSFRGDPRGTT